MKKGNSVLTKESADNLLGSISKGDTSGVKQYIKSGGDVNVTIDGKPLIYYAIKSTEKIVNLLLCAGADLFKRFGADFKFQTPFHISIKEKKHIQLCISYLKSTKKLNLINTQNGRGETALMIATKKRDFLNVRLLLDCGADPTICEHSGFSPVEVICTDDKSFNQISMITKYVKNFTNGKTERSKIFPLYNIPAKNYIQKIWIRNKAMFNEALYALFTQNDKLFKKVLSRGLSVNQAWDGGTLIFRYLFSQNRSKKMLSLLLNTGSLVLPEYCFFKGTYLHSVSLLSEILGRFFETLEGSRRAYDINVKDDYENTPLHVVCEYGYTDCILAMLENGAEVGVRNIHGSLPIDVLKKDIKDYDRLVEALKPVKHKKDLKRKLLRPTSFKFRDLGKLDQLAFILSMPPSKRKKLLELYHLAVNEEIEDFLPLMHAVVRWDMGMIASLLEEGADPLLKSSQNPNDTALHFAANVFNWMILEQILKFMEKNNLLNQVNIKNSQGITPLHYAGMVGDPQAFKLIKDYGGDMTLEDDLGRTPLDLLLESIPEEDLILCGILDGPIEKKLGKKLQIIETKEVTKSDDDFNGLKVPNFKAPLPPKKTKWVSSSRNSENRLRVKGKSHVQLRRHSDVGRRGSDKKKQPLPPLPNSNNTTPKFSHRSPKRPHRTTGILEKVQLPKELVAEAEKVEVVTEVAESVALLERAKQDNMIEQWELEQERSASQKKNGKSEEVVKNKGLVGVKSKIEKNNQEINTLKAKLKEYEEKHDTDIKELKGEISSIYKKMTYLETNQKYLMAERAVKRQREKARKEFKKDPNLWEFYRMVNIRIEELFIGCKAVSSGIVDHNLTETLGKIGGGIRLLGETASIIPIIGESIKSVTKGISGVMEKIDHKRLENMLHVMSLLGTLGDIKKISERFARRLTKRYIHQLKKMRTLDEELNALMNKKATGTLKEKLVSNLKLLVNKGNEVVLKGKIKSPIEELAEYTVMKLFEGIKEDEFHDGDDLVEQLLKAVCYPPEDRPKSEKVLRKLTKKFGLYTVVTQSEKSWYLGDIFQRSSVQTNKGRFVGGKIDEKLYGFCLSEIDGEVEERKLEAKVHFRDSVLLKKNQVKTSPGTGRFIKDTKKRFDNQQAQTELNKRQIENAAARRQSLYHHYDDVKNDVGDVKDEVSILKEQIAQLKKVLLTQHSNGTDENRSEKERDAIIPN